jgi:hypothetical protein
MRRDKLTQPPKEIRKPKLLRGVRPVAGQVDTYEMDLKSNLTGALYKLTIQRPKEKLNPIDRPKVQQIFARQNCDVIKVYLDDKRIEFWLLPSGSDSILCNSCNLIEVPAAG